MEHHYLNALRLGFSTKASDKIAYQGADRYISAQLNADYVVNEPEFIQNAPKNLQELKAQKRAAEQSDAQSEQLAKQLTRSGLEWKAFVLQRCFETEFPLREKINLFFQNHFVVTLQSVKVPYWIYKHYETINNYALGNYKTLVKEMVYSNAMIKYLDNQQNRKGGINENLARELLELFTLGEGHYTENDIKNTALALAGLNFGPEKGQYRPLFTDQSVKTVFGRSGNFKINDVVDIIFEQKNTPYFLAEKALKWFFYDNPPADLVAIYGNVLKDNNFELKPFFQKLLAEECKNKTGGHQIKNPLIYYCQIHHDLHLDPNYNLMALLLRNQAMDIYNQPNVKGWKGGQNWLTSQIYTDRNRFIDFIIDGDKRFNKIIEKRLEQLNTGAISFQPKLDVKNTSNTKAILDELTSRMVFETNEEMQQELNQLLKYDFDPGAENAHKVILKVYQYLAKTPEFQII